MSTTDMLTPCHGMAAIITTRPEGRPYMQNDVPDEMLCPAEGCNNSWNAQTGIGSEWNRYSGHPAATH